LTFVESDPRHMVEGSLIFLVFSTM